MITFRELTIEEARTWVGTPYRDEQLVKGVGADCATFPMAVYKAVGLVPNDFTPPRYRPNWFMVKDCDEIYIATLVGLGAREITEEEAQAGDFVVFKFGHAYAHGAIIIDGAEAIHCSRVARIVSLVNYEIEGELLRRPRRFFTFFAEEQ